MNFRFKIVIGSHNPIESYLYAKDKFCENDLTVFERYPDHPTSNFFLNRGASLSHWTQTIVKLRPRSRGFHLITRELVEAIEDLKEIKIGQLHVFIQHTSASLTINENADPDVRVDMETAANQLCPESSPFIHTCEGPDDMPAHVKFWFPFAMADWRWGLGRASTFANTATMVALETLS